MRSRSQPIARVGAALLCAWLAGCATQSTSSPQPTSRPTSRPSQSTSRPTSQPTDDALARVATIHGGLGPWAVAGLRMGQRALAELGRARGDMRVVVEHRSPAEVQWSCIADGLQAGTGASTGKLNLTWLESTETHSVIHDRETGRALTFRLTESFKARYLDVPPADLDQAAREAARLDDDAIFTLTEGE